ncbi:hypothetical protein C8R43DRAFT_1113134 [Mycena crocata]|nr:hypothetical protein C8R43DRAFT_1113134 [Mycena crocata]
MLDGRYHFPIKDRGIPYSDCGAEIVAVGDAAAKEFGSPSSVSRRAFIRLSRSRRMRSSPTFANLRPRGKISTINYKTHPNWAAEAKRLSGDKGVDFISLTTSGPRRLHRTSMPLLTKALFHWGIAVGSKLDFQALNSFSEAKDVKLAPAIDKVFAFDDSKTAFEYLQSGKAFGKAVIKF